MANQYKNEVIYNGQTLISLKEDTVTPDKVLAGETFHDRSGEPQTGSMITHNVYDGLDSSSTDDALSANMGRLLNSHIASLKKFNYVDISDSTPINISNKASEAGVSVNVGNFIAAVAQDNEVICLPYYSSKYNKMYCALKDLNMATVTGTKNIRVYYRT